VDVRVDESRQERDVAELDHLGAGDVGADRDHVRAVQHDGRVGHQRVAVEEPGGPQRGEPVDRGHTP
jgi:hypothetical protein